MIFKGFKWQKEYENFPAIFPPCHPKIITVGSFINSLPDNFNGCVFAFMCIVMVFKYKIDYVIEYSNSLALPYYTAVILLCLYFSEHLQIICFTPSVEFAKNQYLATYTLSWVK